MLKPYLLILVLLMPGISWAEPEAGTIRHESVSGIPFVYMPSGCFQMGSYDGEPDETPVHEVCFEKGFWLAQTEITQTQFEKVMGERKSKFSDDKSHPVESIGWKQSMQMAAALSAQTGKVYRLPTEAEWEYGCTAGGQHTELCGEGEIDERAWYEDNSDESTQPVGEKNPNAWGLFDMSGNVREWVQDCWNDSYQEAPNRGEAWLTGDCQNRVIRGSSWSIDEGKIRARNRNRNDITSPSSIIGFRLVSESE